MRCQRPGKIDRRSCFWPTPPLLFASAIIRGAGGGGIEASVSLRLGMGMSPHNGLRLDPATGEVETTGM